MRTLYASMPVICYNLPGTEVSPPAARQERRLLPARQRRNRRPGSSSRHAQAAGSSQTGGRAARRRGRSGGGGGGQGAGRRSDGGKRPGGGNSQPATSARRQSLSPLSPPSRRPSPLIQAQVQTARISPQITPVGLCRAWEEVRRNRGRAGPAFGTAGTGEGRTGCIADGQEMDDGTAGPYKKNRICGTSAGPVFDENSRELILGSIHPRNPVRPAFTMASRNRFWPVLAQVFGGPEPGTVEEKRALALRHGWLWDVLAGAKSAERTTTAYPLPEGQRPKRYAQAPIQAIFTTGAKAGAVYKRYCLPVTGMEAVIASSTSPANCRIGCRSAGGGIFQNSGIF